MARANEAVNRSPSSEGMVLILVVFFGWLAAIRFAEEAAAVLIVVVTVMALACWAAVAQARRNRTALRRRARRVRMFRQGRDPDALSWPRLVLRRCCQAFLVVWTVCAIVMIFGLLVGVPVYFGFIWLGFWGIPAGLAAGAVLVALWMRAGPAALAGISGN